MAFSKYINGDDIDIDNDQDDEQYIDEIKRVREYNVSLKEKYKLLEIKVNTLLAIINILTVDSPTHKALVNVSLETLDML